MYNQHPLCPGKRLGRELQTERTIHSRKTTREHTLVGPGGWGWRVWGLGTNASKDAVWPEHPGGQATEPQQHQTPRAFHGWWDGHGDPKPSMDTSRGSLPALLEGPFYGGKAYQGVRSQQTGEEALRAGNWRERLTVRVQACKHGLHNSLSGHGRLPGTSGCSSKPAGDSHAGQ